MLALLLCLIKIADLLRKQKMNNKQYFFVKLPFSIYFGWITVAIIANITAFLVSVNWNGFGISESIWTILIIIIGTIIGILRTLHDKNVAYALVFVWAYTGIIIKHVSETGFNNQYLEIITAAAVCIFIFLLIAGFIAYKNKKNKIRRPF